MKYITIILLTILITIINVNSVKITNIDKPTNFMVNASSDMYIYFDKINSTKINFVIKSNNTRSNFTAIMNVKSNNLLEIYNFESDFNFTQKAKRDKYVIIELNTFIIIRNHDTRDSNMTLEFEEVQKKTPDPLIVPFVISLAIIVVLIIIIVGVPIGYLIYRRYQRNHYETI